MYYPHNQFLTAYPQTYFERAIQRPDQAQPMVALTFDDGPGPQTPLLVELLKQLDVRASFFVLAGKIPAHQQLLNQMLADGHYIGMHGAEHVNGRQWSAAEFWQRQMAPSLAAFKHYLAYQPQWFRPPFGEINEAQVTSLQQADIRLAGWSIDPRDWSDSDAPNHVERVVGAILSQIQGGDIVLLHDVLEGVAQTSRIVAIAQQLIPALKARGFQLVTIDQLAAAGVGPSLLSNKTR